VSERLLETRRRLLRYLAMSPLALPLAGAMRGLVLPAVNARAEDAIRSVSDALSVFDFEEAARRALPPAHWGYLATGVNDDRTLRANREAFERVQIRARHLVDVSRVDTATEVLGQKLGAPLFLCPVSSLRAFHSEGELAVARAAKAEGTVVGLSTMTTSRIEEVTAARGEPVWFQLYPSNDTAVMRAIVKRAEAAGCRVLLLTVDMPLGPNRETQFRLAKQDARPCAACHEKGFAGQVRRKPMYDGLDVSKIEDNIEPAMDWDYVKRLRDLTPMKVVLKGIVTREDAALAVEHGIDAVYVSNHGGRSEESGRGALDSLPEVAEAVAGRIPVLVDSGFRRGTDIFKALALGATAVGIGRPYVWGLAAFGEEGVAAVIRMLKAELVMAMQTCGTPRLRDIGRDRVKIAG
jgi:isopentenyl diphosphate isomerase/L-lactate dehydrogenase-like FMN-dependent dehydrogenase